MHVFSFHDNSKTLNTIVQDMIFMTEKYGKYVIIKTVFHLFLMDNILLRSMYCKFVESRIINDDEFYLVKHISH